MTITKAQLAELLGPYSYCPLECDGMTKVFSTLLRKREIPHTVFIGSLSHKEYGVMIPTHLWVETTTAEGQVRIDYCARMWLSPGIVVPHGIFSPTEYPDIIYEGEAITLQPLTDMGFALVTSPIRELYEANVTYPGPVLYTVGYRQPYALAILHYLTSTGLPLIDIRERAGSRYSPKFNKGSLTISFDEYHHVRELGNKNHRIQDAPVAFVDLETGIQKTIRIIQEAGQGKGAIFMCACDNWQKCHRSNAADHLAQAIPHLTIIHIPANAPLVIQRREVKAAPTPNTSQQLTYYQQSLPFTF